MIQPHELQDRQVRPAPAEPTVLTPRQSEVLSEIIRFHEVMGECRASWVARRLDMSRNGVLEHATALWRKGWLRSKESPFKLRRNA